MAILCNGKKLPITIAFAHDYGADKPFTTIYSYDSYTQQDSYIELFEGLKTGIKFFADSPEDFDDEARIEIQTSLYDTTDTQESLAYPLTLEPELNWIYSPSNDDNFPWRMGTYLINIYYKGQTFTTGFFVKPLYLSKEQVQTVHHYLESKVEGIIYDLIYSNESLSEPEENLLTNWYYDYARYIIDYKESIHYFN
jgi:hypothetical protein